MRHCFAFVGILVLLCCPAFGESILGDLLTVDGMVDSMNDNSRSIIIDGQQEGHAGYNVLSPGDQVVGILQIERVNHVDPSTRGIFAIFAFELSSNNYQYGGSTFYRCNPIAASNANSLKSLLDDPLEPAGFNDWDNAMFAFVEIDSLGVNDPKDPFSAVNSSASVGPFDVITDVLTQANGYRLDMITGFEDENDFLVLRELVQFASLSQMRADDSGVQVFSERAGMSVLYDVFDFDYLPLGLDNTFYGMANTSHEFLLNPDGAIQTSSPEVPNWHFEDDANFRLNAVPEPGALMLGLSLLAAIGLVRFRR